MDIQSLRYLVQIERFGSINKAAQQLFISQSALSRLVKEAEERTGFAIFYRTSKGVVPTADGKQFLARVQDVLTEIEQLESQYFNSKQKEELRLLIATQRCSPVMEAFLEYYTACCQDMEYQNLVLKEETTENIIQLINTGVCPIGILHYTNDGEGKFLQMCQTIGLEVHLIHESPVCIQVRGQHPLAKMVSINKDMLRDFPHVTYSDEDITKINYCSDIFQYNQNLVKKRIIVQDRGTLQQIIDGTDAYYIGCDFSNCQMSYSRNAIYIPLNDTDLTIKTCWVQRNGYVLTSQEQEFIQYLERAFLKSNKTN